AVCDAIAAGRRPSAMPADEEAVYNFATELLEKKQVSDATFDAAKKLLGERGVVDLISVMGWYGTVSMYLNVDRYPLPEGSQPELKGKPYRPVLAGPVKDVAPGFSRPWRAAHANLSDHQRSCSHARHRTGHAAPVGAPRHAWHDWHEVRLRDLGLRRVHGAGQRPRGPFVHVSYIAG